jgi:hypothetical protein
MRLKSFLFVGVLLGLLFSFSAAFAMVGLNENLKGTSRGVIIGFHPVLISFRSMLPFQVFVVMIGKHDVSTAKVRRVKLPSTDPSAIDEAIQSLKSNPAFAGKIKYVEPNMVRKIHGSRSPGMWRFIQSGDPTPPFPMGVL